MRSDLETIALAAEAGIQGLQSVNDALAHRGQRSAAEIRDLIRSVRLNCEFIARKAREVEAKGRPS